MIDRYVDKEKITYKYSGPTFESTLYMSKVESGERTHSISPDRGGGGLRQSSSNEGRRPAEKAGELSKVVAASSNERNVSSRKAAPMVPPNQKSSELSSSVDGTMVD